MLGVALIAIFVALCLAYAIALTIVSRQVAKLIQERTHMRLRNPPRMPDLLSVEVDNA